MTRLQIALASLDAFVIVAGASVVGNLLAGRIQRWWEKRDQDRRLARFVRENFMPAPFGIVREPMPGGRCAHLRERELCDECNEPNNDPKGT